VLCNGGWSVRLRVLSDSRLTMRAPLTPFVPLLDLHPFGFAVCPCALHEITHGAAMFACRCAIGWVPGKESRVVGDDFILFR